MDKTLLQMRDEVRNRGEFLDPPYGAAMLNGFLNGSTAACWAHLIDFDDSRTRSSTVIAVLSGTESYSVPSDYWQARAAAVEDSSAPNGYTEIRRRQHGEEFQQFFTSSRFDSKWDIEGDKLYVWPKPSASFNLMLVYTKESPQLTTDSSTLSLPNDAHEWIILDTLIKCGLQEESSVAGWQQERQLALQRLAGGQPQNRAHPKCAVSIYGPRGVRNLRRLARN